MGQVGQMGEVVEVVEVVETARWSRSHQVMARYRYLSRSRPPHTP